MRAGAVHFFWTGKTVGTAEMDADDGEKNGI